ncbi:hypothetical protein K7X08_009068 [Anisodus acutangulus]|uniref:Uncharacterized protein n=1 Tax=Anisodus acutangulus TaxID=402998 RepID=A0A9Q1RT93_9SOLA|nr:hypothetical protein K7X08_009068 [Anisodus acutangulus]
MPLPSSLSPFALDMDRGRSFIKIRSELTRLFWFHQVHIRFAVLRNGVPNGLNFFCDQLRVELQQHVLFIVVISNGPRFTNLVSIFSSLLPGRSKQGGFTKRSQGNRLMHVLLH